MLLHRPERTGAGMRLHIEDLAQFGQELGLGQAVQILDQPVVVHDEQIIVREHHRHDEIELLVALVAGLGGAAAQADLGAGGGAVMAIGDIEIGDGGKAVGDLLDHRGIIDRPQDVGDAVRRLEVIGGLVELDPLVDQLRQPGMAAIGQEDRLGVGVADIEMVDAVELLVLAGELMPLDRPVLVLVDRDPADNAGLDPAPHHLAVDAEPGDRILDQRPLGLEAVEGLPRLGIDRRGIGVDTVRQIDLGTADVQKGERVAGGHRLGLGAVHHVIGQRGQLGRQIGTGTDKAERSYGRHGMHPCDDSSGLGEF